MAYEFKMKTKFKRDYDYKRPSNNQSNQLMELSDDDVLGLDDIDLQQDASDADKQVMVMSETIDLLRRHLDQQRKELQSAYRTLREYEEKKTEEQIRHVEQHSIHLAHESEIRELKFV